MTSILDIQIEAHYYDSILALQDCHFHIPQNSLSAIIGPNGGGKSTLLKLIAGLMPATNGRIKNNTPPEKIAYLPQSSSIDRTFPLHVEDVVAMGLWPQSGIFKGMKLSIRHQISQALDRVGLTGFEHRSLEALSGGQLQRLFFARVITQNASLILLDEPFTGIDQPTTKELMGLIMEWISQGKTVIAVLHDINMVRTHFPETALIARTLIAHGPTQQILTTENFTKAIFNV